MRRISGIRNTVGPELNSITCTSMISGSKGDTRKSANMQGELLRDYQHPDVIVYGCQGTNGELGALFRSDLWAQIQDFLEGGSVKKEIVIAMIE